MAINYNNIGRIYKDQDIYGKAAEYYLKAFKINEEIGNKKGISDSTPVSEEFILLTAITTKLLRIISIL